jgi:plastocyanin
MRAAPSRRLQSFGIVATPYPSRDLRPVMPGRSESGAFRRARLGRVASLLAALLLLALVPAAGAASPSGGTSPSAAASVVFVNVSATAQLGFTPVQFTVPAGASVHLTVTQLANFPHTFTLSPVANATIPSGDTSAQLNAYFQAHPPIVNVSMGSTPNVPYPVTFTAPPPGTYEFVCLLHFSNGMVGQMVTSSGGGSASTSSPFPTYLLLGAVVVVVVAAVGVAVALRRRRS